MSLDMALVELREEQIEAHAAFQAATEAIKNPAPDADLAKLKATFEEAEERYNTARKNYTIAEERKARARAQFELAERASEAEKQLNQPVKSPNITGVKEPLTYRRRGEHSFFTDVLKRDLHHDPAAAERLSRHQREMANERRVNNGEQYDLSSTDSAGGYLVAPLYLQNEFITLARAGRVTADVLGARPLPENTDSINLPRMATGTAVASQAGDADGGAVTETDATFDTIAGAVKTVAGMQDVSQQLVDRSVPGIDDVIFADLAKAYAVDLDTKVLNSGTANNKGLLQASGLNAVTFTSGTPTVAELYPKIADAIQQIATGIYMPATHILMHPRRWAFILASLDSSGRPLVSPVAPQNPAAGFGGVVAQGAVGSIQGLPVFVDPNIPTNLGTGTDEDRIIVVRADECYLWEDPSGPYVETFRDVGSGTLTVRFRLHNYWAQINERRPKAISVISGTGLSAPSF